MAFMGLLVVLFGLIKREFFPNYSHLRDPQSEIFPAFYFALICAFVALRVDAKKLEGVAARMGSRNLLGKRKQA